VDLHLISVLEGNLGSAHVLHISQLLNFGVSLSEKVCFEDSKDGVISLFGSSFESSFGKFGSLSGFEVHVFVVVSFVDGFYNVGHGSFGVLVLVHGEGDFVDFGLKVVHDVLFGLASDQEVSGLN